MDSINKQLGTASLTGIGNGTITGAISSLNTSLTKIGTIIKGTPLSVDVPSTTPTAIAQIDLDPGTYIILASGWGPFGNGVHFMIYFDKSAWDGQEYTSLWREFNITSIYSTKVKTTVSLMVENYDTETRTSGTNYNLRAIRIA
jgi:hypothetical protein